MNDQTSVLPRGRLHLLEPEQGLIIDSRPMEAPTRLGDFSRDTGIPVGRLYVSPHVSVPLPCYESSWRDGSARDCPTVNVGMMWHPLMWLPPRLARGFTWTDAEGVRHQESADQWALRVALELSACGLFDAASGAWVDVLHLHGLDLEEPQVLAEVAAWLQGAPHPVLDAIDLDRIMLADGDDPKWALEQVMAAEPALQRLTWATTAQVLYEELVDLLAHEGLSEENFCAWNRQVAVMASRNMVGFPGGWADLAGDADAARTLQPAREVAERLRTELARATVELDGVLDAAAEVFEQILAEADQQPQ